MMKRTITILCVLASMGGAAMALAADPSKPAKARPAKALPAAKAIPAAKAPLAKKLAPPPALPVGQIVDRNIAARGGLAAWRAVNGLSISGEMDAGGHDEAGWAQDRRVDVSW